MVGPNNTCQAMHRIPPHATAKDSVRTQGMPSVYAIGCTSRAQK